MVDVRLIGDLDVQDELRKLHDAPLNYDLDQAPTREGGWNFDEHCREQPGDPEPDGPWEAACRLVRDDESADPSIAHAVWLPDQPLQGRAMLLEGRFGPLRVLLGCRVSQVVDEGDRKAAQPMPSSSRRTCS